MPPYLFKSQMSLVLFECMAELGQKILVTLQGEDLQIDTDINYGFRLN